MQALIISSGQDTGGQSIRWKRAADRHMAGRLRVRAVTATVTYAKYPTDILASGNGGAVRRLWIDADVVHLNNRTAPADRAGRNHPKPGLLHHHGTIFRTSPHELMADARARRYLQAVSTLDLTEFDPEHLHWLPTPYNVNELLAIGVTHRREPDGMVRIASAPTFREGKGTAHLIAAVEKLQADGLPVELDLIENVTNAEVIQRKAAADIYFDQVATVGTDPHGKPVQYPGGYGNNAVEAWGVGLAVVAGATPYATDRMRREFNGHLPYVSATTKTLTGVLRRLVQSADMRAEWAEKGMEHIRHLHDEVPALERLMDLYQRAIALRFPGRAVA